MIFDSFKKIGRLQEGDLLKMDVSEEGSSKKTLIIFRVIFYDIIAQVTKVQVIATSNIEFPVDSYWYFSSEGKYLVRLVKDRLLKTNYVALSLAKVNQNDNIPIFEIIQQSPNILLKFIMNLSSGYYSQIRSLLAKTKAEYDSFDDVWVIEGSSLPQELFNYTKAE